MPTHFLVIIIIIWIVNVPVGHAFFATKLC